MASAPAVVTPPPLGSTRLQHVVIDWSQSNESPNNNFGPGQGIPWFQDRINLSGTGPGRGGAWNNLSGVNKQAGETMAFLGASSFNQGIFGLYNVPCFGRNPAAAPAFTRPENQQYWCWNFRIAQGQGIAQSGFTPVNPPYATVQMDLGVFFFIGDFGRSSSSYQQFGDYLNAGGSLGGEAGFGFFYSSFDGLWHYGIRYQNTGVAHALDVNVPLVVGRGIGQWPVPLVAGSPDYSQYVPLKIEFFAPGATAPGSPARVVMSLGGLAFVNTTIVDQGGVPAGAGFASQLPNPYDASSLAFGWITNTRAGSGTGSPVQTFGMTYSAMEFISGPNLPSTYPLV